MKPSQKALLIVFGLILLGAALWIGRGPAGKGIERAVSQSSAEAEELLRAEKNRIKPKPESHPPSRDLNAGPYLPYNMPPELTSLPYNPPWGATDETIRRYYATYAYYYAKNHLADLNVETAKVDILVQRIVVTFPASTPLGIPGPSYLCQVLIDKPTGKVLEIVAGG
jgi:hypothetical protein